MKQALLDNLKNLAGWKTDRKLIVFSVDDYGNVRLHSAKAAQNLHEENVGKPDRFDAYDALETREDLEMLYEALDSVKDQNGKPACFSPFALPANIDFETIAANNYQSYSYELLPITYQKLTAEAPLAYEHAWNLWQEGIDRGFLQPQFHGREHLNLKYFEESLAYREPSVMRSLAHRSYSLINQPSAPTVTYTAAFSFWETEELSHLPAVIESGLNAFEQVYGYRATVFTPPSQQFHHSLESTLLEHGIEAIDKPFHTRRHLGNGQFKRVVEKTAYNARKNYTTIVRNVVFEPAESKKVDWVNFTLRQIETAFRWRRPAIVSSHRVNFCGHISSENRKTGIDALKQLLKKISQRWPDVEYISVAELARLIQED